MSKIPSLTPTDLYPYLSLIMAGVLLVMALVTAGRTGWVLLTKTTPPAQGSVTPQEQTLNKALELMDKLQLDSQITPN